MVDISQDIEWEQNFEFDQKIQAKVNNTDNNDNNNHSLSSNPQSSSDDEQDINDPNYDPTKKKKARRPSNAELIDRVIQQQQKLNIKFQ